MSDAKTPKVGSAGWEIAEATADTLVLLRESVIANWIEIPEAREVADLLWEAEKTLRLLIKEGKL